MWNVHSFQQVDWAGQSYIKKPLISACIMLGARIVSWFMRFYPITHV